MSKTPSHIVIEGPIGVGKTSLARRIADALDADLLLEAPEENPFLDRFYQNPRAAALPTQLTFLMQRTRQVQALRQADLFTSIRIADFLIEKDRLFAEATLDEDELRLYEQVWAALAPDAPAPDLVVYLQAPVEVLHERIERRARPFERMIDSAYLQRLCDAYAGFFHHYTGAPLLIVNASRIDWVSREEDFRQLLDMILNTRAGRHYFNPMPFSM